MNPSDRRLLLAVVLIFRAIGQRFRVNFVIADERAPTDTAGWYR